MTTVAAPRRGKDGSWSALDEQLDLVRLLCEELAPPTAVLGLRQIDMLDPNLVRSRLADFLGRRVIVTGQAERRLVMVDLGDKWRVADLGGQPLSQNPWPDWFRDGIGLDAHAGAVADVEVPAAVIARIERPRLVLAALYHPEYFPLPRFPLGISDVARAARISLCGRVTLLDMQLGDTLADIAKAAAEVDVLGISATFGQHDLQVGLLQQVYSLSSPPLVIAGGSLTVRNERRLLEQFPELVVARGAGEDTIQDVIAYRRDDLPFADVRGIGFSGASRNDETLKIGRRRTGTVPNRDRSDILPELDLLGRTFGRHGVAQLEASRGCTNYCSFCPRGHKGMWSGDLDDSFEWIVNGISQTLDEHPDIRRTVYLVDEEFIGRGEDSTSRALSIAKTLHRSRLTWETSCRADQVVRHDRDTDWHVERAAMWRDLVQYGLKRCLFGIESGVTSILERFNKETDSEQNALTIRTLSALGVPTRFTYITFDQLMTFDELERTAAFQARRDLVLRPLAHLSVEQIVAGVRDPEFVAAHAVDAPFYAGISYMLVSMECLIGAAYTNQATAAGLTGAPRPAMGSVEARFADWRIGVISHHAQLWIDRNFALDYTMKSLEKIVVGEPGERIRSARRVLKQSSFALLENMIRAGRWHSYDDSGSQAQLRGEVLALMEDERETALIPEVAEAILHAVPVLTTEDAHTLRSQHDRWLANEGWRLINAADNCD